jgi:membrane protease YdiL (CAAX protease family)
MDPRTLMAWAELLSSWDAWLLTFVLVVVVPAYGYFRFRRFAAGGDEILPTRVKVTLYGRIVCSQWVLVAAMMWVVRRHGLSLGDAGERLADTRLTLLTTLALLLALAIVSAIVLLRIRRAKPQTLRAGAGRLRKMVPAFGVEMAAFAVVCLTAGICEELLYRGWLVTFLRAATGSVWAAVAIGAIVFGIGHAYQGVLGMLRTAFIGLQLAILFAAVDSLIPGQVLHFGFDLLAGMAGAMSVSRTGSRAPAC